MYGHKFYHGTIRRYIILFGTSFNQIYISRTDSTGATTSLIRVPITYGPKDKALARVFGDPALNRPFSGTLPYITFELKSMKYNGDRHLNKLGRHVGLDPNKNVAQYLYNPSTWDFFFEMNVLVKNAEDGTKIVEQILPFFVPEFTTSLRIIDDPKIVKDIPLELIDHEITDTWEGSFEERKFLAHKFTFKMEGYLFGPKDRAKIIKQVNGSVGSIIGTERVKYGTVHVKPGMTIDGKPTSDPDESVDYSDIDWTMDYGFILDRDFETAPIDPDPDPDPVIPTNAITLRDNTPLTLSDGSYITLRDAN